MEVKAVATNPCFYATIASLAVLIIGAIAFQKIGLLKDFAPHNAIIMMSFGGGFIFLEGLIWSCQRSNHSNDDIQFFPPNDSEKCWMMSLPGESKRLPFVLLGEKEVPKVESNEFVVWSSPAKRQQGEYHLRISMKIETAHSDFIIGYVINNAREDDHDNRIAKRKQCLKLIQDNELEYQPNVSKETQ